MIFQAVSALRVGWVSFWFFCGPYWLYGHLILVEERLCPDTHQGLTLGVFGKPAGRVVRLPESLLMDQTAPDAQWLPLALGRKTLFV